MRVVHLVGTSVSDQNAAYIFRLYSIGGDSISSWNVGTHLPDYLVLSPLKSMLLPFTSLQISICLPLWIFKKQQPTRGATPSEDCCCIHTLYDRCTLRPGIVLFHFLLQQVWLTVCVKSFLCQVCCIVHMWNCEFCTNRPSTIAV